MHGDRPLVVADDDQLLDQILRLAAAAGCELQRAPDVAAARLRWTSAPLVLLDEAALRSCAAQPPPRRDGVVVVCPGQPPPTVWPLAVAVGVQRVVELPAAQQWLASALADAVEQPASTAGRVLAVLGGCGGAGASVLATAVAVTAWRRGSGVLLVDCDPAAGGLDLVLGAETEAGLRWPELRIQGGRVAVAALRSALPGRSRGDARLSIVSCDRAGPGPAPEALAAVLEAGRRAGDTVVCDLPRALSDTTAAALDRADLAVVVVPAAVRAVAAARRIAGQVTDRGTRAGAVVRGPAPGGLRPAEVADAVGLPLLAAMRPERGLPAALDRGSFGLRPRGPLAAAATAVLTTAPTRSAGARS